MDCQHLEAIYELFLLGALGEADAAKVREHVDRGCPNCLHGLREGTFSIVALLQTAKVSPSSSPKQKARLLKRLKDK
jgi:hypothetical protein